MNARATITDLGTCPGPRNRVLELSDYVFHPLNKDEELVLSRGQPKHKEAATILLLAPASLHPQPEAVKKIEHEYSLANELEPTWAVRPIAFSRYKEQSALVLEDPGGELLSDLIRGPMETRDFLRLAICLANALVHLHKRHLIHKDLKPSNILVEPAKVQVWLTGFGIASRLARERQQLEPPEFIAGTFAYMAPEQTGRMNRSIDSRTDLYALGITLYELLTGGLPFAASDPMEWVHCHIARQPTPPCERVKNMPSSVSAIVMKLLAKTPEERYQTAAGAENDLRRCLIEWESRGCIDEFPIGERDVPDRLLIPEKLYGRELEIKTLLAAFDRIVVGGRPELVLVAGYSGIGKSSVINELHKPLVPPRGLFASGKFDQYKRDIPYATLAQAFQTLVRSLLSNSEAELGIWRDAFREALGTNGLLMLDLVPQLKLIIGEQPPVPDLPPQDAQHRFQLVFRRFIAVFARPEHPLALFLDDLQWLDAATLDLLEDLLTQPNVRHLILLGAYRDNEVDPSHPLMRKLEAIRKAGAMVQEIVLAPLAREKLEQLLGDALHCEPERAVALAHLLHEKTGGNPFFALQFLASLAEEGLLTFDHANAQWRWDLNRIRTRRYSENVVDLMVGKLSRLSTETQKALQLLACIGNSAEFTALEVAYDGRKAELHSLLWEAVQASLILRTEDSYTFLHDRVQEAAYSLIPEESRAEAHLRIGKLLVAKMPSEKRQEKIFEIVNQLNRGSQLITSSDERKSLAELNLIAGRRAKLSTAYASALNYFVTGRAMLDGAWEREHELTFQLELDCADCEFVTGQPAAAEERLSMLACRAANTVELATVACLRVDLYTTRNQSDRAVTICLDCLRAVGVDCSPHPTELDVKQEYERIWSQLGNREIEDLIDLPLITDPASLATLDVLTKVLPAALFTDPNLLSLVICRAVNFSLERGNSDASCVAYVWLGQVAGPHFGNYKAGSQFGRLGYELGEKRGLRRFQARTNMVFASHVMPWAKHVRSGRELLVRTFEEANRIGDLSFAAYSRINLNTNLLAAGDLLPDVQREAENALEFAQRARFGYAIDLVTVQLVFIRTLRGLTTKFGSFDDHQFAEPRYEQHLKSDLGLRQAECFYWIRKLQARFLAGDYGSALDASLKAEELLWTAPSNWEEVEYHFYSGLCRAACWSSAAPEMRKKHFDALTTHKTQLEVWAENCPENFENRAALVAGEIARIEGRALEAGELYEKAIRSAHANGFVQNEAVANEIAARFYAARGFEKIARSYLRDARYYYQRWGSDGKVRQLDDFHPHLSKDELAVGPATNIGASLEHLDLATVIKVSQTVSAEMDLEKLIDTVMRAAIEHAGAARGLLVVTRGDGQRIEAVATTIGDKVLVARKEAAVAACPQSMVNYVIRTHEFVIMDDASSRNRFAADPYFSTCHARSVLCLPLVTQGKLVGVLYLENNLAPKVFTPSRIAVLTVLALQAAISLENTGLYTDLRRSESYLAEAQRLTHTGSCAIDGTSGETVYWSEEMFRLFGFDPQDGPPRFEQWLQRIHPEDREKLKQASDRTFREKVECDVEFRLVKPNGTIKHIHGIGHPVLGSNGELAQVVGTMLDITERRRAEEARDRMRQLEADLARVNRVSTMGELTASLAHEIKQPIGAAVTNAEVCLRLLERDQPDVPDAREAALEMAKDARRAADIIERVRSLFQKGSSQLETIEVNEVIGEMVVMLRNEATRQSVTMRTDLAEGLPEVMADRVQLQQVLMNLMLNGVEAMWDNGGELNIKSELSEDGQLLISISDDGVGLPSEKADQIFNTFFTTKPQGTGLGLAITRSIVESHGGRVWATANSGRGTTFYFTLPIRTAVAA